MKTEKNSFIQMFEKGGVAFAKTVLSEAAEGFRMRAQAGLLAVEQIPALATRLDMEVGDLMPMMMGLSEAYLAAADAIEQTLVSPGEGANAALFDDVIVAFQRLIVLRERHGMGVGDLADQLTAALVASSPAAGTA